MPKTIDPETLDIHDFEKKQIEIDPLTEKEKIDPRTTEGIEDKPEPEKHHQRYFSAIIGNIILPGLGNTILKKTKAGYIILGLNILFLILTVSPVSLLGFIGNKFGLPPQAPAMLDYLIITASSSETIITEQMNWLILLPTTIASIAWLHLGYLILKKANNTRTK